MRKNPDFDDEYEAHSRDWKSNRESEFHDFDARNFWRKSENEALFSRKK